MGWVAGEIHKKKKNEINVPEYVSNNLVQTSKFLVVFVLNFSLIALNEKVRTAQKVN